MKSSREQGQRKTEIIILFLITLVLSLFFWLKRELPNLLKNITSPYKIIIEKGGESK